MEELILNNSYFAIKSVVPLFKEKEELGVAKIERFLFNNPLENIGAYINGGYLFSCMKGHYVKLLINNELVMSDTPMERRSNDGFVRNANGAVLVAGLGLGMVIQALLEKDNVMEILVIEKCQDVIDLVAPKFNDPRLKVVCADIFDFKLPKSKKFDVIYFDIWPDICTSNLDEISILHNKFKHSLNRENPKSFMDSWMKEYLKKKKKQEAEY